MSHNFPTSPVIEGEQRKFINPTTGYVGANVFGPDGKPTAVPVEPGGEVWLTPAEERMTAEAPRSSADNPFVKEWDEPVGWDPQTGEPTQTVSRKGTLVLSEEPPRPVASDRFIPERGSADELKATRQAMEGLAEPATGPEAAPEPEPETVTGAPEIEEQSPVEGQPSPDEVVGTPDAKAANDKALAGRESTAEQRTGGAIPA